MSLNYPVDKKIYHVACNLSLSCFSEAFLRTKNLALGARDDYLILILSHQSKQEQRHLARSSRSLRLEHLHNSFLIAHHGRD
jgi:hypothetical protein